MEFRRLTPTDTDFPPGLRRLADSPRELYVRGSLSALGNPCLAVVGSRQTSRYGQAVTQQLAGQAAGQGITIISGLAFGTDAHAHQAALDSRGITAVVLGSGIDRLTPYANEWLGRRILDQGGVVISEYPPGTVVHKANFIARNRLMAALSQAVLVTEAGSRSGALHTAAFALDLGIPVLAVPGPINTPGAAGTNQLLKTGAIPVTELDDILLALHLQRTPRSLPLAATTTRERCLLELLARGVTNGSELQRHSRLPPATFNQTLTILEIQGQIRALGSNHWCLK